MYVCSIKRNVIVCLFLFLLSKLKLHTTETAINKRRIYMASTTTIKASQKQKPKYD